KNYLADLRDFGTYLVIGENIINEPFISREEETEQSSIDVGESIQRALYSPQSLSSSDVNTLHGSIGTSSTVQLMRNIERQEITRKPVLKSVYEPIGVPQPQIQRTSTVTSAKNPNEDTADDFARKMKSGQPIIQNHRTGEDDRIQLSRNYIQRNENDKQPTMQPGTGFDGGPITENLDTKLDNVMRQTGSTDSQIQSELKSQGIGGEARFIEHPQLAREFNSVGLTSTKYPNKAIVSSLSKKDVMRHETGHMFGNGGLQVMRKTEEGEG
ncbi:MAG: hypothetical protein AAF639_27070, partial [Chloroflexota bacterium]